MTFPPLRDVKAEPIDGEFVFAQVLHQVTAANALDDRAIDLKHVSTRRRPIESGGVDVLSQRGGDAIIVSVAMLLDELRGTLNVLVDIGWDSLNTHEFILPRDRYVQRTTANFDLFAQTTVPNGATAARTWRHVMPFVGNVRTRIPRRLTLGVRRGGQRKRGTSGRWQPSPGRRG